MMRGDAAEEALFDAPRRWSRDTASTRTIELGPLLVSRRRMPIRT